MMGSDRVRITRQAIDAVSNYEFATVQAMATDDLIVEQPFPALGMLAWMQGRDAFVRGLSFIPAMFAEFKLCISNVYDCPGPNVVFFEQTSRGVFRIDGSPYANRYMMMFGFRDGLIERWKEYYNPLVMNWKMTPIVAKMAAAGSVAGTVAVESGESVAAGAE